MPEPTATYNEKDLLQQVALGNERAFRQLFLHWHQLLGGYIYRITESREVTEEIVQDVFLKIWLTRETAAEINNLKHYLLVVSRNRAFDAMRKQLKVRLQQQAWQYNAMALQPAEEDRQENWLQVMDEAIDRLPPRRKEVWLLSRHERLTYQEIAARLGISRESVKTHLQLASSTIAGFIRDHRFCSAALAATLLKIIE